MSIASGVQLGATFEGPGQHRSVNICGGDAEQHACNVKACEQVLPALPRRLPPAAQPGAAGAPAATTCAHPVRIVWRCAVPPWLPARRAASASAVVCAAEPSAAAEQSAAAGPGPCVISMMTVHVRLTVMLCTFEVVRMN